MLGRSLSPWDCLELARPLERAGIVDGISAETIRGIQEVPLTEALAPPSRLAISSAITHGRIPVHKSKRGGRHIGGL